MGRRKHPDEGMAALFALGLSVVLLACAGLVIDGGVAINARMRVADDAEQAARVGADSINVQLLRAGGSIEIDDALAQRRAAEYLATRGYGLNQFNVDVLNDGSVDVTVRDTTEPLLLSIIGVPPFKVGAGAVAAPETDPQGGP